MKINKAKTIIKQSEKLAKLLKLFKKEIDWEPYTARITDSVRITIQGGYNEKVREYLSSKERYHEINDTEEYTSFIDDSGEVMIALSKENYEK